MGMSEEEFQTRNIQPPWSPVPFKAWHLALMMAEHLSNHKMQLFQYLKASGVPVNTATLYGM